MQLDVCLKVCFSQKDSASFTTGSVGPGPLTIVEGEFEIGSQYHFHLEPQTCIVRPIEDGQYQVLSSTQHVYKVQAAVARALDISENAIDCKVRRLGGAFGGKISRPNLVACACALASLKTGRAVRIVLDLTTNMELVGKRLPYLARYKVRNYCESEREKQKRERRRERNKRERERDGETVRGRGRERVKE
jgi:xanthine dehydrogenase molybdopterin-binding subunit B